MNILALDLGTQMGYAIINKGKIKSGTQSFKATRFQSADRRFTNFKKWLAEIKTKVENIDVVYYEEVRKHLRGSMLFNFGNYICEIIPSEYDREINLESLPNSGIFKNKRVEMRLDNT